MDARPTPVDIIGCRQPSASNPNNANNANNFSYEKVSISYDVVRTVQAVVAMPKHLLARRLAYSIREAVRPAAVPGPSTTGATGTPISPTPNSMTSTATPKMPWAPATHITTARTTRIIQTTLATKKSALATMLFGLSSTPQHRQSARYNMMFPR